MVVMKWFKVKGEAESAGARLGGAVWSRRVPERIASRAAGVQIRICAMSYLGGVARRLLRNAPDAASRAALPEDALTSAIGALPADAAGADTLEIMSAAPRYARWQVEVLRPWLGRRILEIGSGIGNISSELRALDPELLVLTDTDPWYLNRLKSTYATDPVVRFDAVTLPDPAAHERLGELELDTVVSLNVLEHIEDDLNSLRTMRELVRPGGKIVLLVPAMPALYGTLDVELQHFRRYTRESLRQVMEAAGLNDVQLKWYNRAGVPGWWFNARIRKATRVPIGQLRVFDALVPLLRYEKYLPLPFGQSLIAVGTT